MTILGSLYVVANTDDRFMLLAGRAIDDWRLKKIHSARNSPLWKRGVGGFELLYYNKRLKRNARTLRNNMTDAERFLWSRIRRRQLKGLQFYRQKIIGNYIVDFYCPKSNLVIEVDGGQHHGDEALKRDAVRDSYLERSGLSVLRFSAAEVMRNIDGVVTRIYHELIPLVPFTKGETDF